jgi:pyroglutamyl-peptidase
MNILLTGFEPFGDVAINPSQAVVQQIAARTVGRGEERLVTEVLPVEFEAAGERMRALIRSLRPEVVVALGLAGAAQTIRLERVALNLDDAQEPDNAGMVATGRPIVPGGPAAYWSTVPLEALKQAIAAREIPVRISNHAGTYVCNHVFYVARHEIEQLGLDARCGLIHVPLMTEQLGGMDVDLPSLPLEVLVEAAQCCLDLLSGHT